MTGKRTKEFFDHIVDIGQGQRSLPIVDPDRQIRRDIAAKGRRHRIIVRSAPFAEQIGKAVYDRPCAGFCAVRKDQILGLFFGPAIRSILSGMDGRGKDNSRLFGILFQVREKLPRELYIAGLKLI